VWLNSDTPPASVTPGPTADRRRPASDAASGGGQDFRAQPRLLFVDSAQHNALAGAAAVYASTVLLCTHLPPGGYIVCISARSFSLLALAADSRDRRAEEGSAAAVCQQRLALTHY
jgi:hypothetical protein